MNNKIFFSHLPPATATTTCHLLTFLLPAIFLLPVTKSFGQNNSLNAYAVFSDSARVMNQLEGTFHIYPVDTLHTAQIELSVGVSENDTSLLFQVIDFDNSSTLPAGYTYVRTGNRIVIGATGPTPAWTYFCRVRIKNNQGTWSQPYVFLAN